ncbi:hypothetical protein [Halostella sp. PRR32]|uniref:hypothetical protein n=1 Tax=Halostella sp. PRR32 TaxID=3098147 RepID=UPI002B1D682B|nr:hypothetical protein [Halostella sp. PRR32]
MATIYCRPSAQQSHLRRARANGCGRKYSFMFVRPRVGDMDRQQIISLVLVFLMLGSSIAYAATII